MAIVDPMHNLFMGLVKQLFTLLRANNFLTAAHLEQIQSDMNKLSVPSDVGRIPRKIASKMSKFTASQWKNWIIIYARVLTRDCLWPDAGKHTDSGGRRTDFQAEDEKGRKLYRLVQLLSSACEGLCVRAQTIPNVKRAHELLLCYCHLFKQIFGSEHCSMNVHMSLHSDDVLFDFGSAASIWLFAFERYNGILKGFHTNNRSPECTVMDVFITYQKLVDNDTRVSQSEYQLTSELKSLISKMINMDDVLDTSSEVISKWKWYSDSLWRVAVSRAVDMDTKCATACPVLRFERPVRTGMCGRRGKVQHIVGREDKVVMIELVSSQYDPASVEMNFFPACFPDFVTKYRKCVYLGESYGSVGFSVPRSLVLVFGRMEGHLMMHPVEIQEYIKIDVRLPTCGLSEPPPSMPP